MFTHKYTCNQCHKNVTLRDSNPINPLSGRLAIHDSVASGRVNVGWGWIPQNVTGAQAGCYGSLVYKGCDAYEPVAVPPPPPQTAADVSLEFSAHPADKNTICGGIDIQNPATKRKGVNAHGKVRGVLHASLRAVLANVAKLEGWSTDNCAEIDSVDRLFSAGVAKANIRVHSRDQFGRSKPRCDNCQGWLTPAEGEGERRVYRIR